jgi:hypothetical protein
MRCDNLKCTQPFDASLKFDSDFRVISGFAERKEKSSNFAAGIRSCNGILTDSLVGENTDEIFILNKKNKSDLWIIKKK